MGVLAQARAQGAAVQQQAAAAQRFGTVAGGPGGVILPPKVVGVDGTSFTEEDTTKNQCNALLFGDGGTGKTTFVTMHAPQPVAFINFDNRDAHAVKRAREAGRRVFRSHVPFNANIVKLGDEQARKIGMEAVNQVVNDFEWAVRQSQLGNIRTIAIDTGTEYSELLKIAITGRIDKTKGDYGKSKDLINREWWKILNTAREGNAHLVILSRAKAIWLDNEPTGQFTYRGPEVMYDGVDWAGQIRLKRGLKGKTKKEFEIEVKKAGVNIEELGAVYDAGMWEEMGGPFVFTCMMQYVGSEMEDWQ